MKTNPKLKKFIIRHIFDKELVFRTCKSSPTDEFLTKKKRHLNLKTNQREEQREEIIS